MNQNEDRHQLHLQAALEISTALQDVSLEVPEGSLTALLGPSGSGKSTLLRIIAGLETPDSGTVLFDGDDVSNVRPQKRGIGFVFQHYAAFTHMSVRENVAFGLRIRKRPRTRSATAWMSCWPWWASRNGRSNGLPTLRRPAPADGAGASARRGAAGAAARRALRRP